MVCENCGIEHDGSYGSGRFCSKFCAHSFIAKQNMDVKNKKRREKQLGRKLSDEVKQRLSETRKRPSLETHKQISLGLQKYYKANPDKSWLANQSKAVSEYCRTRSVDHTNDTPPEGCIAFGKYLIRRCSEHHKAYISGNYVYDHILAAESKLGRLLLPGEVVHHIDFDGWNNSLDNLMVFRTEADHSRYHYMLVFPDKFKLTCKNGVYQVDKINNV